MERTQPLPIGPAYTAADHGNSLRRLDAHDVLLLQELHGSVFDMEETLKGTIGSHRLFFPCDAGREGGLATIIHRRSGTTADWCTMKILSGRILQVAAR